MLNRDEVECHPFVVGELGCGHLRRRSEILALLQSLPSAPLATHDEVLAFVERHRFMGRGIGWIDAHLLASAALGHTLLWTRDRRLAQLAGELHLSA